MPAPGRSRTRAGALLVVLLLVLVGLVLVGGLVYVAYRRPPLAMPLTVGLTGAGVLAAIVFGIVQPEGGDPRGLPCARPWRGLCGRAGAWGTSAPRPGCLYPARAR
ncbi:hypothetical protein ACWDG1_30380 [Streptomyces sp. NPDC001177]